jgi:hypothetical protein
MPWLQYVVEEVDPIAMQEWEASEEPDPEAKPQAAPVTKTVEIAHEARLVLTSAGGYQNLSLGPGGVTSVTVFDENPEGEPPAEEPTE